MTQPTEDLPIKLQYFPEINSVDHIWMSFGIPVDNNVGFRI
jgi:hypothetical protein